MKITNWDLVKRESKLINPILIDFEYPSICDHFSYVFKTKNKTIYLIFHFHCYIKKVIC